VISQIASRRPRGRARLAALAVALVVATGLALPSTSAAAVPRGFFGMGAWTAPSAADFQTMAGGGVGTVRANLSWAYVEPTPGERQWGGFDRLVADAARQRIRVLPVLLGSPSFAAAHLLDPPRSPSAQRAFADFIEDAVARYKPGGAFWLAHPELPPVPIRAWQVWNEPNHPAYWFGRPNARQYATLVKRSASAIRRADRAAQIVLAGLPETSAGISIGRYLTALYRVRGIRRDFDAVAIHPYARNKAGVLDGIARARAIMRRNGDARTPLWVTEVGWATAGRSPFTTSRAGQEARTASTLRALIGVRRRHRIKAVIWFAYQDRALRSGERDWWAIHTGLFDVRGNPKPAWSAYRQIATRG